jgi:hypothetical protein
MVLYLRRRAAGKYLQEKYGFGAARTLAKLACVGGGPEFCKAGRIALYTAESLDRWAQSKISAPFQSTSNIKRG